MQHILLPQLTKQQLECFNHYPLWKQLSRLGFLIVIYILLSILGCKLDVLFIWMVVWVVQGVVLSCVLVVVHDCAHTTFSSSKKLCRFLGSVIASVLWVNFSLYKCLHLVHHQHTNVDGDTQRVRQYSGVVQYLCAVFHFKFPYRFCELSVLALVNKFPECATSARLRVQIKYDALLLIGVLVLEIWLLGTFPLLFFKLYGIPVLFYLMATFFLTTAEHTGCENTTDNLKNVRTIISNPIFRFLFWNFNYHAEHHLYPSVPAPNLKLVHETLKMPFANIEQSYIMLHIKLLKVIIVSGKCLPHIGAD